MSTDADFFDELVKNELLDEGYYRFEIDTVIEILFSANTTKEKIISRNLTQTCIDTLMCQMASFGHIDFVKLLLENGADIHYQNDSALKSTNR